MGPHKAVFLDLASIHPHDLDLSGLEATVPRWDWRDNTAPDEVAAAIAGADVVVTNKVVLDRELLAAADGLGLVCAAATGFNNIDVAAADELGITVSNARAYATPSVVQHVFMLLLVLSTSLRRYQHDVDSGAWSDSEFFCLLDHPIRELRGLTLGIYGYGELGRAVAGMAQAFGMRVLVAARDENDERAGRLGLEQLLPQVDVFSLHCPLTEATRNLIGERELALMRDDAVLINTARGGLVDERALLRALSEKRLGGAGLDVLETEPPARDHPLLNADLPNLVITPHTAWASRASRQRVVEEVVNNIRAYAAGEPRNTVTASEK